MSSSKTLDRFSVRATECDLNGRMRPDALFAQMQEGAEKNASSMGLSHEALRRRGLFFALARLRLQAVRMPRFTETVVHTTWPGVPNRFFYPRYHTFETEDGETLCRAADLWVTLDPESRGVVSPARAGLVFPDTSGIPAPLELPLRLPPAPAGEPACFSRSPAYSDLDLNGHVNNTRYVTWLCDALGRGAFREGGFIRELTVSYEKEIREDAPLSLSLVRNGEAFSFAVFSAGGLRHFEARGVLERGDGHA